MKLRRSRRSKRGRIEIIPMIDVMFFLLATFMLTSLAMQRLDAVRINLPQGHAQQLSQDKPLTLSVNEANQVFINQQAVRLDQVTPTIARPAAPRRQCGGRRRRSCLAWRRRAGHAGRTRGRGRTLSGRRAS
jgi:biopolymer transport protein ExbD